jgi:hypothetical protein
MTSQVTGISHPGENDTVCIDDEDEDPFVETPRYESLKPAEGGITGSGGPTSNPCMSHIRGDLFRDGSEESRNAEQVRWCTPSDGKISDVNIIEEVSSTAGQTNSGRR